MKINFFTGAIFAAVQIITGCAAPDVNLPIEIERKTYHALTPDKITGKSFDIVIADEAHGSSLEFAKHADKLSSYLMAKGMVRKTAGKGPADYTVFFRFNISGRERTASRTVPHFNVSGGTSNFNATTFGQTGTYNTYGTVTTYPTLKDAGSSTHIRSYTEYTRILIVRMYSAEEILKKTPVPIFETTALSEGTSRDTTKLVPALLDGLLFDFPGVSGSSDQQQRFLDKKEEK